MIKNGKQILTLTWYSVRLVHITISSRMLISGYRFLVKSASSSCNCWLVKWVRLRRWLLLFLLFFPSLDPSNWLSELSQLWLGNSKWYKWKVSFYRVKKLSTFFHLFIFQISANSYPVKFSYKVVRQLDVSKYSKNNKNNKRQHHQQTHFANQQLQHFEAFFTRNQYPALVNPTLYGVNSNNSTTLSINSPWFWAQ